MPPEAGPPLRISLGVSGSSHAHPFHLRLDRSLGVPLEFPAGWALIEHPREGAILFDCGYGAAARTAMQRGARRIYRHAIGACCAPRSDPSQLLAARGLQSTDIRHVVLSHFHPDHVGGLREFPQARCVAHADAWRQVRSGGRFNHMHAQVWRELLPEDLEQRLDLLHAAAARPLDGDLAMFGPGWDLFGDGSVFALELPGHAVGQVGLALRLDGRRVLLVADAFWRREQIDDARMPRWWVRALAMKDRHAYQRVLRMLRRFRDDNPDAWIIPAHCAATLADWRRQYPDAVLEARG